MAVIAERIEAHQSAAAWNGEVNPTLFDLE
jgi:hypothetical protein